VGGSSGRGKDSLTRRQLVVPAKYNQAENLRKAAQGDLYEEEKSLYIDHQGEVVITRPLGLRFSEGLAALLGQNNTQSRLHR